VVKRPPTAEGEILAVYVDSRRHDAEVVYSITADAWRVEPDHRRLMWRTRPATPHQIAEARERLADMGERVQVLQIAKRLSEKNDADER